MVTRLDKSSKSRDESYMLLYRLRSVFSERTIERAIQGDEKALERLENFAYRGRKRPALVAWINKRRKQVRRNSQ
jgi:hypothetical protein